MAYKVNVYCNKCHRQAILQLIRAIPEKIVSQKGKCPNCDYTGKLVFVSSIGKVK